jgi:GH24 family phage-related lysozyme (muramidase)
MEMTPQGLNKLDKLEGDKLVAYLDDAGVWTIGKGWTGLVRGQRIHKGMRITQAESDELFRIGLKPYVAQVNALIKFPVPQRVFEAQVMLAWNIGWVGWKKSSAAQFFSRNSTWNAETIAQLGALMKRYNKIKKNGKFVVSNGLNNRRSQEVAWMQGQNKAPMPVKQKVAAAVGVTSAVTVGADQSGIDSGTLQSVVDNASIFGMTGSTTLALIGSILVIGVVGYIVYSQVAGKFHKAEVDE